MTKRRAGMSLLELILATTLLSTLVAATGIVLRTGHAAWEANNADAVRIASANAVLRHVARRVRQAQAVTNISSVGDASGTLSLSMPTLETYVWDHDDVGDLVSFGVSTADSVLAEEITELSFTGYEADGVTQTAVADDIHSVKCQVSVQLPRDTGGARSVSCMAWLRSW